VDKNRRKFLKIMLIGSGAFIAGKVFGPLFSKFLDSPFTKTDSLSKSKTGFGNFQIVENEKILSVYDNSGEEIFQIDKGV
jgi:hypothetical protein